MQEANDINEGPSTELTVSQPLQPLTALTPLPLGRLKTYQSRLQAVVPRDANERPLRLVVPTLVQATEFKQSPETLIDSLDQYSLPIDYDNGYPCVEGIPLWEQQEFETDEDFALFKMYRDMAETSIQRSTFKMSRTTGINVKVLESLKTINHWYLRACARDLLEVEELQQITLRERGKISKQHLDIGNKLVAMCMDTLERYSEMVSPKLALDILKEATKLQKEAVGLQVPGRAFNGLGDAGSVNISINNQGSSQTTSVGVNVGAATGDKEKDTQRLAELLNVMDSIGVLRPEEEIIDTTASEVEHE